MLRRREPLHERLAREGGLHLPSRPPHDTMPRWGEVAIHGVPRPREWDVVTLAEVPEYEGDMVTFVALPDGSLLVDQDVPDGALEPLAGAVEARLAPPYRAEAVRRGGGRLAVAARSIQVAELKEEIDGDAVQLTVYGDRPELLIDGERAFGSIPSLEEIGERRFGAYVLHAERLDGPLWEVRVAPL